MHNIGDYSLRIIRFVFFFLLWQLHDKDIALLRDKHEQDYASSQVSAMSSMRGIPKISGQVIWALQLERKLDEQTQKIRTVLGEDWAKSPEGRSLKDEVDHFKKLLDSKPLRKTYVDNISQLLIEKELSLNGLDPAQLSSARTLPIPMILV